MDEIQILSKIGLTEKQAIVYTALLELGEASMSNIAKFAKLKRPTVYLIIEELEMLGFVSRIEKGKKKIYSAVHPKRIAELLEFRKNQFQEILPSLIAKQGAIQGKPKIQMFEGMDGIRHVYSEIFKTAKETKEECLWFGNITLIKNQFPEVIREYNKFLTETKNYKIRELIFGGEESEKWVEEMKKKENTKYSVKYLEIKEMGLTDQCIIGNKIIFFSLEKEIFTTMIESKEIAQSARAQFNVLWNSVK
ncbi:MAG: helix-turn-helix domain-containing protein [Candidatus Paceibacterota bacterium]|jgi:sugar-specific transcriptional regulator TrmB